MCSRLHSLLTVILGVGGVFVPGPDPKIEVTESFHMKT